MFPKFTDFSVDPLLLRCATINDRPFMMVRVRPLTISPPKWSLLLVFDVISLTLVSPLRMTLCLLRPPRRFSTLTFLYNTGRKLDIKFWDSNPLGSSFSQLFRRILYVKRPQSRDPTVCWNPPLRYTNPKTKFLPRNTTSLEKKKGVVS